MRGLRQAQASGRGTTFLVRRLDYLGLSSFTEEDIAGLKTGIEALLALYGSRDAVGEEIVAKAIRLGLLSVAPHLLKDRPIS